MDTGRYNTFQHTSYASLHKAIQPLTLADCFPLALGTVYRSSSPWIRCPIVSHVSSLLFPHSTTLSQRHPRTTHTYNRQDHYAPRADPPEIHMLHDVNRQRQPCSAYLLTRDHYVSVPSATLRTPFIMFRTLFIAHTSQCAHIYTHITVTYFSIMLLTLLISHLSQIAHVFLYH